MYNITREEASLKLNISTRTIDRYIRAGKLRAKKIGKIVYINQDDINNFLGAGNKKQQIIIQNNFKKDDETGNNQVSTKISNNEISYIFDKLKEEIKAKDEEIKELNIKIGKMEEIIKNSISITEFKKSQFLLEESKSNLIAELNINKTNLENLKNQLNEEKKLNYILITITIIIFIVLIIIWLIKI